MNRDLAGYRKVYAKNSLEEEQLPFSPLELFSVWFREVDESGGVEEVNAMTLTTVGLDGFPKARIVLLKHFDSQGFVFYTNYASEKGLAIENNNKVCLSFFWPNMERQVIIKGIAEKISKDKSEAYFNSRPRGSQLGAWASEQSTVISSRSVLENKLIELEAKFKDTDVPKPDFWGGYVIRPIMFEFWQGRPNRLHDRILYKNENSTDSDWRFDRLSP